MGEAFIVRRGGGSGLSVNEAVLRITAETGSTITLSKGDVTVATLASGKGHTNAENANYADWYYPVKPVNYGSWTVTATKSGNTSSKTVTVNAAKQYDVGVFYDLYFIRDGVLQLTFTPYDSNMHMEQTNLGYHMYSSADWTGAYIQLTSSLLANRAFSQLIINLNQCTDDNEWGIATNTAVGRGQGAYAVSYEFGDSGGAAVSKTLSLTGITLTNNYLKLKRAYGGDGCYVKDVYLKR